MKKIVLTIAFATSIIMGSMPVFAQEECNPCEQTCTEPCDTTCNQPWVVKTYDRAKEGTVNVYNKVADGTVNAYDKTKDGTVKVYNKVADGTVNAYDKTKSGVEKGAKAVKDEWNKIF